MPARRDKRGAHTRGDDDNLSMDERKRQWSSNLASRALNTLYGEEEIDEEVTVLKNGVRGNRVVNYTPDQLYEKGRQYFQNIVEVNEDGITVIPDVEDFCMFANIGRSKFKGYCRSEDPLMSEVANNIANAIASCKKQFALSGMINPATFAIDMNNNHDYVQARTEVQVSQKVSLQQLESNVADIANRLPMD